MELVIKKDTIKRLYPYKGIINNNSFTLELVIIGLPRSYLMSGAALSTEKPTNSKADAQTETPHSTQKSEPRGRKDNDLER